MNKAEIPAQPVDVPLASPGGVQTPYIPPVHAAPGAITRAPAREGMDRIWKIMAALVLVAAAIGIGVSAASLLVGR